MTATIRTTTTALLMLVLGAALAGAPARGGEGYSEPVRRPPDSPARVIKEVGFDQKLDAQVPLGLTFRDEAGRAVPLATYFGERPVVLALVYYRCPMLCTQTLNGLVRSLKPVRADVGEDFEVVVVSIDPKDTPEIAAAKRAGYADRYGRPGSEGGFHFLTGDQPEIDKLAESVGFRYTYNADTDLYAHAAGVTILTPGGKVARYLFGIEYPAKDLQFALIEAGSGKIGSPIARVLLLCYDYDPASGKYTLAIMRTVRVAGLATLFSLAACVALMVRRERRQPAPDGDPTPDTQDPATP